MSGPTAIRPKAYPFNQGMSTFCGRQGLTIRSVRLMFSSWHRDADTTGPCPARGPGSASRTTAPAPGTLRSFAGAVASRARPAAARKAGSRGRAPPPGCAGCGRQTPVTAGTVMHRSHLPLKTWFLAAHPVATHSNGISALQLQAQPGIGSHRSAWLLLHKLRRAMAGPDRSLLQGIAEAGDGAETDGAKGVAGRGRGADGRILLAGAVELSEDGAPRRIRLEAIGDYGSGALHGFVSEAVAPGARVVTDGWLGYSGLPENPREERVVGGRGAHGVLTWVHRVFSSPRRWAMGVYHGLRRRHVQRYLDGSVFRRDRRRHRRTSPGSLPGIGLGLPPATCRDFIDGHA